MFMGTPISVALARATFATIRGNLAWAFGYNVAMVPLAALGLLNPLIASAAMTLSSTFVVWNSARLQRFRAPSTAITKQHRAAAGTAQPGGRVARLHP